MYREKGIEKGFFQKHKWKKLILELSIKNRRIFQKYLFGEGSEISI